MVRIYWNDMLVDDYGITINLETDIGLITLFTNFPRRNKWITPRSVSALDIKPGIRIEHLETPDLHVRNIQTFTHQLLMKVKESVLLDLVTKRTITKYRKENGRA